MLIHVCKIFKSSKIKQTQKHLNKLIERNHPPKTINYAFTKCFQSKLDKNKDLKKRVFTKIFN